MFDMCMLTNCCSHVFQFYLTKNLVYCTIRPLVIIALLFNSLLKEKETDIDYFFIAFDLTLLNLPCSELELEAPIYKIRVKHDCDFLNHIISIENSLQHERRKRSCCNECFIAIITHTYIYNTNVLIL